LKESGRIPRNYECFLHSDDGIAAAIDPDEMVPISRRKQLAGMVVAAAIGYSLSWLVTPGPGTGPVDRFDSTFGESVAPVIVAPATPGDGGGSVEAAERVNSSPAALQSQRVEPI
jgi:hypothetical protein